MDATNSGTCAFPAGDLDAPWSEADVEQSLPARFELLARRWPGKLAVSGGSTELTFGALDAAANRLAHGLVARGGSRGGRVALLLRHGAELIAAVLGVLKAGKAAVVLNPSSPAPRQAEIWADAEPEVVVTDAAHRGLALAAGVPPESVGVLAELTEGRPEAAPGLPLEPGDHATLLYTSGSTGRPKGVLQTHRNLLHQVLRYTNGLRLRSDDRFVLLGSLSGANGMVTTWNALLNGATLCPYPIMEQGVTDLAAWLVAWGITVWTSSASVFRSFVKTLGEASRFPRVRIVRMGAEPVLQGDFLAFRRFFPDGCRMVVTLSSSETGNMCQHVVTKGDEVAEGRMPVGRPAAGMDVRLLDAAGAEVARGAVGEVVVSSRFLSPGYWRNQALTDERFRGGGAPDALRSFATGDLGRWTDAGVLAMVGRKDEQVKVRGNRVELTEVEAALRRLPEVEGAVVAAQRSPEGDVRLVAWATPRPGATPSSWQLRQALRATLPGYMVPTALAVVEAFPLTPHGKIDRTRLAQLAPPSLPSGVEAPPQGELEEAVASAWASALGLDAVGREVDFFQLGGDSLAAVAAAAKLHAALGVKVALSAFVDHPTVAAMARVVAALPPAREAREGAPSTPAPAAPTGPLSWAQERVFALERAEPGTAARVLGRAFRLRGVLDADLLRRALEALMARQEALRTRVLDVGGRALQELCAGVPAPLEVVDLAGAPRASVEEQGRALLEEAASRPFDLGQAPLFRVLLVRLGPAEHALALALHGVVADCPSLHVFWRELGALYAALAAGGPSPLPPLGGRFVDLARAERARDDGGLPARELAYWRGRLAPPWPEPFELPGGQPPSPGLPARLASARLAAAPGLARGLRAFARGEGATPFQVLLAACFGALHLETGREDLCLGTPADGREDEVADALVGPFANHVALRARVRGDQSFRQLLAVVRSTVLEAVAARAASFDALVDALGLPVEPGRHPLFQVSYAFAGKPEPCPAFPGVEAAPLALERQSLRLHLRLRATLAGDGLEFVAEHRTDVVDGARVGALLRRHEAVLAAALARPDAPLAEL